MKKQEIIVSVIGGLKNLEKNFIYVAKEHDKKGLVFESVCPAKEGKYERLDIIERVVKFAVADYKRMNSDAAQFGALLGIVAKSVLKSKLSYDYLFVTDTTGQVVTVISSEIPLRETELKLNDNHTLLSATRKNLKAAIYNHAKYVDKQMSIYTHTYAIMRTIDNEIALAEKEQADSDAKTENKTENKKQKQTA